MITRIYLSIKHNYFHNAQTVFFCWLYTVLKKFGKRNTWLLALSCTDFKSKLVWITLKLSHANVSKLVLDEKRCALIKVLLTDANDV